MTTKNITYHIEFIDNNEWTLYTFFDSESELDAYLKRFPDIVGRSDFRFVKKVVAEEVTILDKDKRTIYDKIHQTLTKDKIPFESISWESFNLFGDAKSIVELQRLISVEARNEK